MPKHGSNEMIGPFQQPHPSPREIAAANITSHPAEYPCQLYSDSDSDADLALAPFLAAASSDQGGQLLGSRTGNLVQQLQQQPTTSFETLVADTATGRSHLFKHSSLQLPPEFEGEPGAWAADDDVFKQFADAPIFASPFQRQAAAPPLHGQHGGATLKRRGSTHGRDPAARTSFAGSVDSFAQNVWSFMNTMVSGSVEYVRRQVSSPKQELEELDMAQPVDERPQGPVAAQARSRARALTATAVSAFMPDDKHARRKAPAADQVAENGVFSPGMGLVKRRWLKAAQLGASPDGQSTRSSQDPESPKSYSSRTTTSKRGRNHDSIMLFTMRVLRGLQARSFKAALAMEERVVDEWQRALGSRTGVKIRMGTLIIVSVLNVSAGALLYKIVTGSSWLHALFKVYGILFNVPGTDVTSEMTFLATLVVNSVFIVGILFFAVLLGLISEEVGNRIVAIRSGIGPLRLKGHILVLNCNEDIVPVIQQLAAAAGRRSHPFYQRAIVLLAGAEKPELDEAVASALAGVSSGQSVEIHTRSGVPYSAKDLRLVSAGSAAYVMLLHPLSLAGGAITHEESAKVEALNTKTVLALNTLGFNTASKQHLVVQVPNSTHEHGYLECIQGLLAGEGRAMRALRIPESKVVDRLIAQTALQPGVLTVLETILEQGSVYSFWNIPVEEHFAGSYRSLRRRFSQVCVIGYHKSLPVGSEKRTWLNPDDSNEVAAGDNLIVLAHTSIIETLKQPAGDDSEMLKHSRNAIHRVAHMGTEQVSSRRLLVVGWPLESISEVLAGLSSFAPPGSEATFLVAKAPDAVCAPQKSRSKSGDRSNLATEFIETEITMGAENFRAINLATCDSVIIGVPSELGYPDSDALVLSALLQIQKLAAECERMVHVVFKASSPNTKEVALQFLHSLTKCYVSVEVVLTSQLTSAILTQVLWQPSVIDLVVELMVYAEGNELYLLEPDQLGLQVGESVSFGEMVEAGKLLEMSVLGLVRHDKAQISLDGRDLVIAPPCDEVLDLHHGDKIVVIADLV